MPTGENARGLAAGAVGSSRKEAVLPIIPLGKIETLLWRITCLFAEGKRNEQIIDFGSLSSTPDGDCPCTDPCKNEVQSLNFAGGLEGNGPRDSPAGARVEASERQGKFSLHSGWQS